MHVAACEQAASDAGQSAVEYLATVVEFDAWDKLDKDWTSNVALRNMTPDNVGVRFADHVCVVTMSVEPLLVWNHCVAARRI